MVSSGQMKNTYQFLRNSTLGIFGAGHLGRALASGLLDTGFPRQMLAICHRESTDTDRQIAALGLSECVTDCSQMSDSKILFYAVRPQDCRAIAEYPVRADGLMISFLAGIALRSIPVSLAQDQRVRVITSAPETLRRKNGIAALFPPNNIIAREILSVLGLQIFPVRDEETIHAFTALATCLPTALTYWEALGREVDKTELLDTAVSFDLSGYPQILAWARTVQPRNLSVDERDRYVAQAATPGGVTEAILSEVKAAKRLSVALIRGIHRSRQLSAL